RVHDASSVTVTVNGVSAQGYYGSFFAASVPLALGDNLLTATATDALGNVTTSSIHVTRQVAPDFAVTQVSGTQGATDLDLSVTDTVSNLGPGAPLALEPASVAYYLSLDGTFTNAYQVGSRSLPSLTAGQSSTATTQLTVSTLVPPGTYYLGALVVTTGGD